MGKKFCLVLVLILVFSLIFPLDQTFSVKDDLKKKISLVMDRVEEIRELKFIHEIPIKNISREELKNYLAKDNITQEEWELTQQEYEALYILRENQNAKNLTQTFYSQSILGFYDYDKDEIAVVEPNLMDDLTLAHELNHALIDQHFPKAFQFPENLTDDYFAHSALVEGDAMYTQNEYYRRCLTGIYKNCYWFGRGGSSNPNIPESFVLIHVFPYIEGENFVEYLYRMGGWEAVNQDYKNPPKSTEQIIHPEKYGVDNPTNITIKNKCINGWKILGEDKLGEFAIFVMFWNWGLAKFSYKYGRISYSSTLSDGWDGDWMVVYKKTPGKYGYIWRIVWDSKEDAEDFVEGYIEMLKLMGAVKHEENTWKIDEDDYVKIFVKEKSVTILNAPTPQEMEEIYYLPKPITLKIQPQDIYNEPLVKAKVNKTFLWVIKVSNDAIKNKNILCIIQIKNENGTVINLKSLKNTVPSNGEKIFQVEWTPKKPGTYKVEVYAWLSWEKPKPLSDFVETWIKVTN